MNAQIEYLVRKTSAILGRDTKHMSLNQIITELIIHIEENQEEMIESKHLLIKKGPYQNLVELTPETQLYLWDAKDGSDKDGEWVIMPKKVKVDRG